MHILKLSDNKFVQRSLAKEAEDRNPRFTSPSGSDLSELRHLADKRVRKSQLFAPNADGSYEPVTFQCPQTGRRIYGWLVGVQPNGDARVELGNDTFAIIEPSEIRRIGQKENREAIQAKLRAVIGQVATDTNGVRADFCETQSLLPISVHDETMKLLSLSYAASIGMPTDEEVTAYVQRNYPDTEIVESDATMPGRISVMLHFGAKDESAIEEVDKTAAWPFTQGKPKPDIQPGDAARAILSSNDDRLLGQVIKTYFDNGGASAVAKYKGPFNTESLIVAAIPVIQRASPQLYRQISELAIGESVRPPMSPPQADKPESQEKSQNTSLGDLDPFGKEFETDPTEVGAPASTNPPVGPGSPQHVGPVEKPMSTPPTGVTQPAGGWPLPGLPKKSHTEHQASHHVARRAAVFQERKLVPAPLPYAEDVSHLTSQGLPPALTDVWKEMKLDRLGRRGDYVFGRVSWDPKVMEGRTDYAIKISIMHFVGAKAGSSAQGRDFGIIGKVYVSEINKKKGEALVQFASEHKGPATMVTQTESA